MANQSSSAYAAEALPNFLPVIGFDMLKPQPKAVRQTLQPIAERTRGDVQFEILHKIGVQASAVEEDGEFIVLEGSWALTSTGYAQQRYGRMKEKLISEGGPVQMGRESFASCDLGPLPVLRLLPRWFWTNSSGRTKWKIED